MCSAPGIRRTHGRPRSFSDEDVFQAIVDIVVDDGMNSVSLPAIAKKIGYSHQAITFRFESKAKLMEAFGAWHVERVSKAYQAIDQEGLEPFDRLRVLLTIHVRSGADRADGGESASRSLIRFIELEREPLLRSTFEQTKAMTRNFVVRSIELAQQSGHVALEHNAHEVAEIVWYCASGASLLNVYEDPAVVRRRITHAIDRALAPYLARD